MLNCINIITTTGRLISGTIHLIIFIVIAVFIIITLNKSSTVLAHFLAHAPIAKKRVLRNN